MDRLEVKFATDNVDVKTGEFSGYGAVFGNIDSHGDVIAPGAFNETLAEWSVKGRLPSMKLMHGTALNPFNGDDLPIGKWQAMREDSRGLFVKGKLSAIDTDFGKRIYALMKDGALDGLSIGYRAKRFSKGSGANGAKRILEAVHLGEVSLVDSPSNDTSRVSEIKAIDRDLRTAIKELGDAIDLHQRHMDGTEPTDMASQKKMMRMMERAYDALTSGTRGGMKSIITIREFEDALKEAFGFSNAKARSIAAHGFKATDGIDEDEIARLLKRNVEILLSGVK